MFSTLSKSSLAKAALFKNTPIYVQFYVTARCNLTCTQCNIIYANSDVRECTLDEIKRIGDNLAELKTAIILLTGGEPYVRKDLPEIIQVFESRGIHVRMQTNGTATDEAVQRSIEYGGKDISISLDSLVPETQDKINGGFPGTWLRAIKAISTYTKYLPREGSFASLGCVLQRDNLYDLEDVIKFGTAISWYTSLVPIHVTTLDKPMNFRSFDQSLRFSPDECVEVETVVDRVRQMREDGFLLYDSDQYLDDIIRFVANKPTTWRSKNGGVCDSPNLYFAILPNGHFAPCCDHRLSKSIPTYDKDFPKTFYSSAFREEVFKKTKSCSGCMYGSYPEMTISMRFLAAKLQRLQTFFTSPPAKSWPYSEEQLCAIAEQILKEKKPHDRPAMRTGSDLLRVVGA